MRVREIEERVKKRQRNAYTENSSKYMQSIMIKLYI